LFATPFLDQQVADPLLVQQLAERAILRVRPGVVADQSFRADSVAGEEGESAFDEAGDGGGAFVWVELGVGEA
jgi:hypothetical protein